MTLLSLLRTSAAITLLSLAATPQAATVDAIEFYHAGFDHYFMTTSTDEAAVLDAGVVVVGWKRTGLTFKVESTQAAGTSAVCRFFSTSFAPKSSHFYTASASECNSLKSNPNWQYEGIAFYAATPSVSGACSSGDAIYRMYNNGQGGAPNHRFTTSTSTRTTMLGKGWVAEGYGVGVSLCATPTVSPGVALALAKSNQFVGGTWFFSYTYGASYTDRFKMTSVAANTQASSMANAPYNIWGTNKYNDTVLARWSISDGYVMMLSPLLTSWDIFIFDFSGTNGVVGCYYYDNNTINPFSLPCTVMAGVRSATLQEIAPRALALEVEQADKTAFATSLLPSKRMSFEDLDALRALQAEYRSMRPY